MNRKHILMASAIALGIAISGPALASDEIEIGDITYAPVDDHSKTVGDITYSPDNSKTVGDITYSPDDSKTVGDITYSPDNSKTVGDITYAPDNSKTVTITKSESDTKSVSVSKSSSDVVADQALKAVIVNRNMDDVVDTDRSGGYDSGDNEVGDSAFAAFAGILNQAWNTGVNANTQAGSNIAARGNVHFGDVGCCASPE
jgi:hypothetical protein